MPCQICGVHSGLRGGAAAGAAGGLSAAPVSRGLVSVTWVMVIGILPEAARAASSFWAARRILRVERPHDLRLRNNGTVAEPWTGVNNLAHDDRILPQTARSASSFP